MKGQVGVMKKKLYALFLVLVLILCQLPQITAAAEDEGAAGEPAAAVSVETKGEESAGSVQEKVEKAGPEEEKAPALSSSRENGPVQEKAEKAEPAEEKDAAEDAPSGQDEVKAEEKKTDVSAEKEEETGRKSEEADQSSEGTGETAKIFMSGTEGAYQIYTSVTGKGSVTASVDGNETDSADESDFVSLTFSPASGYEFSDVRVENSDGEPQQCFNKSDTGCDFWMPGSLARVYVTFAESGSQAPSASPTDVKEVLIGVAAPLEGNTTETSPEASALGTGYTVTSASWCDEEGDALDSVVTFAGGGTYYMKVSVAAEKGYAFPQGSTGTSFDAQGGDLKSSWIMNWMDMEDVLHSYAELVIAVKAAAATSFFGVLISDTEGTANKGGSYYMDYSGMEGDPSRTGPSNNFVVNGSGVYLEAYPADGYRFVGWYQGDPDRTQGSLYTGEPLTTERDYQFTAPIGLSNPHVCAVFEEDDSPRGDQVQMWVGNTQVIGPNSSAQGGKVAVKYTPGYDIYPEIRAKDGTDFVAGEILPFYRGDECTVYAKADEGFSFVGWYHVNIEWGPGETLAWQGDMISSESSITYKPGVTVLPGDTEPLRYVCAVFEKKKNVHTVIFYADDSKKDLLYTLEVEDSAALTDPAQGAQPQHPGHPFWKFEYWALMRTDGSVGMRFAFNEDYPYVPAITEDLDFTATWGIACRLSVYDRSTGKSGNDAECGYFYDSPLIGKARQRVWGDWTYGQNGHLSDHLRCYAEEGYEFEGWYLVAPGGTVEEDGILFSDSIEVDYTPENGSNQEDNALNILYAVFGKKQCRVSFDAGEGRIVPDGEAVPDQILDYGSYAQHPENVRWGNLSTRGWHTAEDPGTGFKFSDTPITKDTVLYPNWVLSVSAHAVRQDANYARGGGTVQFTSTSLEPYMPAGPDSIALTLAAQGIQVTAVAEPADGYEFAGWVAGTGPAGDIVSTSATYSFSAESDAPDALFALFKTRTCKVTFVPRNGGEAFSQTVLWGQKAVRPENPVKGDMTFFGWDIYPPEELTEYDKAVLSVSDGGGVYEFDEPVTEDLTLYAVYECYLNTRVYDVTEKAFDQGGQVKSTSFLTVEPWGVKWRAWCFDCIEAEVQAKADEGYDFLGWSAGTSPGDIITGEAGYTIIPSEYETELYALFEKAHEHSLVPSAGKPASCTEDGTEAYWTCSECGRMFSDEAGTKEISAPVTISATGHDWGGWTVEKEPTGTEEGIEVRTCRNDPSHTESREIPVITYRAVSGDGSVYTKGSGSSPVFVFKRSFADGEAFSHFTGITVDGEAVAESDFTAVSGSVEVTPEVSFLETLSLGEHTLTALFEDGNDVTVGFTVKEKKKSSQSGSSGSKKDTKKSSKKSSKKTAASGRKSPATGDDSHKGIWTLLLAASAAGLVLIRRKRHIRSRH